VAACGPCGWPLIMKPQVPQMPSRQSLSKAMGSAPFSINCSFQDVEHLEERGVLGDFTS